MLIKAGKLKGYGLLGQDGEIGKAKDFYFDDQFWTIRYLVAESGRWLSGREVLISPYAVGEVIEQNGDIAVHLTKQQIKESPSVDSHRPISRQFEESYNEHYGYPRYWGGSYVWGLTPYLSPNTEIEKSYLRSEKTSESHLRSSREVTGYHVEATDGEIGHVRDFVIDSETWTIRYLIIETKNWLPGKKVLISPTWIERVSWGDQMVYVNLSRDAIEHSAELHEDTFMSRAYEASLYRHYGRTGYWNEQPSTGRNQ